MTETSVKLKLLKEREQREKAKFLELINELINCVDNPDAVKAVSEDLRVAMQDMRSVNLEILQVLHQEILSQMEQSKAGDEGSYASWQQLDQTMQLMLNWVASKDNFAKRQQNAWKVIASLLRAAVTYSKREGFS